MNVHADDKLLTRKEAAEYLGVKESTLAAWASRRTTVPFVKLGRLVRYRKSSLDALKESKPRR